MDDKIYFNAIKTVNCGNMVTADARIFLIKCCFTFIHMLGIP